MWPSPQGQNKSGAARTVFLSLPSLSAKHIFIGVVLVCIYSVFSFCPISGMPSASKLSNCAGDTPEPACASHDGRLLVRISCVATWIESLAHVKKGPAKCRPFFYISKSDNSYQLLTGSKNQMERFFLQPFSHMQLS